MYKEHHLFPSMSKFLTGHNMCTLKFDKEEEQKRKEILVRHESIEVNKHNKGECNNAVFCISTSSFWTTGLVLYNRREEKRRRQKRKGRRKEEKRGE